MKNLIIIILLEIIVACSPSIGKVNQENADQTKLDTFKKKQEIVRKPETPINSNYLRIRGDSVELPSFEIEVLLSTKAERKLKTDKESIIVMAYFSGYSVNLIPEKFKENVDETGELILLSYPVELTDSRLAKFENLKFSKELYNLLDNKDINVLINVYSGRRSSEFNILDCELLQDSMSNISGKRLSIKGDLIYNN